MRNARIVLLASVVALATTTVPVAASADPYVPPSTAAPARSVHAAGGPIIYTYSIGVRGAVRATLADFVEETAAIYADPRGWSLGGSIHFVRVASGGDFILWLSSAAAMQSFSPVCSPVWNCTVFPNVIVNDDRWTFGSPMLNMSLREYHALIINHETGHWLGLHHTTCPGPGQLANVMQQQSKGGSFLGPCLPNAWPRPWERAQVANARGVPVIDNPLFAGMAGNGTNGGYWLGRQDGHVVARGSAPGEGDLSGRALAQPIVGIAAAPKGPGYWLVARDGGVFSFGGARFYGSTGNKWLNQPIVGMAPTPTGHGYWLVAADGGVFTFGDARFHGSTGAQILNQPIVGIASTPDGRGYWLVAFDGGVFTFGDARFHGSTGAQILNQPIVGMAPTSTGGGYWLVASDGGIFTFGDAPYHGSTGGQVLNQPIVGMTATPGRAGYWLVGSDGRVFPFGDAAYRGGG